MPIRAGPASAPLIELTMQLIDASKAAGVEIIPGGANPDPNRKARRQAVEAQDSSVSTRPRPPGGARRLSDYRHFSMRCSLFRTAIRPDATSGPCHLHLDQPFFLQFSRRERAFLLLVPVGPTVVRRRRLKFANRASCRLDGAFLFRCGLALLSGTTGQRVVQAQSVQPATAAFAFSSASALACSKILARSASNSLMR